jgi:hypothetical protein
LRSDDIRSGAVNGPVFSSQRDTIASRRASTSATAGPSTPCRSSAQDPQGRPVTSEHRIPRGQQRPQMFLSQYGSLDPKDQTLRLHPIRSDHVGETVTPVSLLAVSRIAQRPIHRGYDRPLRAVMASSIRKCAMCCFAHRLGTVSRRVLTMSGGRRSSPPRVGVPRAKSQTPEARLAECPRCQCIRSLVAYQHGWAQCHVCQACHHVWDVDTTPLQEPRH